MSIGEKPSRNETCPSCGRDLKACVNCRFFSPLSNRQCLEPLAELVADKEKANFCEYFYFTDSLMSSTTLQEDPLKGLKSLFTDIK
ncbi:MAG: hypothetical protein ACE5EZ_01895 [Thermodesulfobacteriota bacterium]